MAKRRSNVVQMVVADEPLTYFQERMQSIGIHNTADHYFTVEVEAPARPYRQLIFTESENGDVEIHYPCLFGGPETFMRDGKEHEFIRRRLHPDNVGRDDEGRPIKYRSEPKSGTHIFIPPAIIEKVRKKEKIQTLHVIEGEFKAWAACDLLKLNAIGISGISMFTDDSGLHRDIKSIINKCEVENLNLVFDADCFDMGEWDVDTEPHKDLAKRLNTFSNNVIRFREVAKDLVADVYFSALSGKWREEGVKGLDDMIAHLPDDRPKITEDFDRLTRARTYITVDNIKTAGVNKIRSLFSLRLDRGVPSDFYRAFQPVLANHEFNFQGARYQYIKGEGLQLTKHEDNEKFIRVGTDYFKLIQVPNSKRILERKRIPWKKGELGTDYVNQGHKDFIQKIPKFDAFCNVPEHDPDKYEPVIHGCYNMYYKLDHKPTEGPWPTIEKYLKHAFGEAILISGHTNYELALDYLTLLYTKPTQQLPIVCLVSKEKNTGKSTFLWLLREIFNENATVIGNAEINDNYNDDYITKLIIGIDEGFIDKKLVLEKIKSQSTNDKAKLHGKFQSRQDVGFIGKYVLTSNNEDNFVMIDDDEQRFWVNRVAPFKKEDQDSKLVIKMIEEIPAFLHFLKTRIIVHPDKSRHWFDSDLLETEALRKVKDNSQSWMLLELRSKIRNKFDLYEHDVLFYTSEELEEILNKGFSSVRYREADIAKQLKDKFNMHTALKRFKFPLLPDARRAGGQATEEKRKRCYSFAIEDFMSEAEIKELLGDNVTIESLRADRDIRLQVKDSPQITDFKDPF